MGGGAGWVGVELCSSIRVKQRENLQNNKRSGRMIDSEGPEPVGTDLPSP